MRNKMLKTQRFVLCLLVMLMSSFAFAEGQMKLILYMPTTKFIAGEPIECLLTLENNGDDTFRVAYNTSFSNPCIKLNIKGPVNGKCVTKWYPEMGFGYVGLLPKEAKHIKYDLHGYGVGSPGDYEVWVEYNTLSLGDEWSQIGVPRLKIESNHFSLKITEPEGIEAEIYAKFGNKCNQIELSESQLLQNYPTSTYAAYAVYEKNAGSIPGARSQDAATQGENARKYAQRLITPKPEDKVYKASPEFLNEEVNKIEQVLKCHPDFVFRSGLYFILGIDEMERGQYVKAVAAFKKCLEENPSPKVTEAAKIYLDVLKEHGWE